MAGLEGTIQTPFGAVQKKTALLIGGGAILIMGIVWYRTKQQNDAALSASAGAAEINPATGYPFGSAEDAAAMAAQAAYIFPESGGNSGGGGGGYPQNTGFTNNGQWAQAAIQYMQGQGLIEDPSQLSAALGKYLAGQPAGDANTKSLIEQAIAFQGYPPLAGPNGYPPSINTGNPVTPPTTPPTSTQLPAPTGFRDTGRVWRDHLEYHWNAVPGAARYRFSDGSKTWDVGNVTGVMRGGLVPDGSYYTQIAAIDANGVVGKYSGTLLSHTKR